MKRKLTALLLVLAMCCMSITGYAAEWSDYFADEDEFEELIIKPETEETETESAAGTEDDEFDDGIDSIVSETESEAGTEEDEESDDGETTYYATTNLNIRDKAGTDGNVIGMYNAGDEIKVVSVDPDTEFALTEDGGYVSIHYITDNKKESAAELLFEPRTVAKDAGFDEKVEAFAEEADDALYSYVGDTIFISIQKGSYKTGIYYLTHVIIEDPSQIHGDSSYGTWGGTRETASEAAERTGAILLTNGGGFSYDTGKPHADDTVVIDGEILNDVLTKSSSSAGGGSICLKDDGTLFMPEAGLTGQDLLNDGVVYTWTFGPLLIKDGVRQEVDTSKTAPRTAYGMVAPCEYYIITSGTFGYVNGFYYNEMQDIFEALECDTAINFDGGGSTTLVFDGELINEPAYGEERAVVDFVYFTE